jgi:hypothetical protein
MREFVESLNARGVDYKRAANRPKDQADVAELEARPPRRRRLKKAAGRRSRAR